MTTQFTRKQLESLKVGDLVPNGLFFEEMTPITEIFYKGEDINGKFYICFYQKFGETINGKIATISNSLKEY